MPMNKLFDEDYGKAELTHFKEKCRKLLDPEIRHYALPLLSLFDAYKALKQEVTHPVTCHPKPSTSVERPPSYQKLTQSKENRLTIKLQEKKRLQSALP